jgi:hypothetical protein
MYSEQQEISSMSTIDESVKNHFLSDEHHKKIKKNLLKICHRDILNRLCFVLRENHIVLDYRYFKFIANKENYEAIILSVITVMHECLHNNETMVVHLNMKSLTLLDIEKHFYFIREISIIMQQTFPDKLDKCFVYNAPFLFSQLYNTISMFIDKKTQKKIELVSL